MKLRRLFVVLMTILSLGGILTEPVETFAKKMELDYDDGDVYYGKVAIDEDGFYYKQGKGTYYCSDGTVITGTWKDNYLTGKGKVVYPNKEKYVGYFKYDIRSGKGKYYFKNKDVYDGYWQNDLMHGKGTYTWKNKNTIVGKWKKGLLQGTCTFTTKKYVYKLTMKNGELQKVKSKTKRSK